jgi:hypothetical protein
VQVHREQVLLRATHLAGTLSSSSSSSGRLQKSRGVCRRYCAKQQQYGDAATAGFSAALIIKQVASGTLTAACAASRNAAAGASCARSSIGGAVVMLSGSVVAPVQAACRGSKDS